MTEPASLDFVDTHAHLDDEAFTGDVAEVITNAAATGVRRIVNIGYHPAIWGTTIALAQAHPGVSYALGLHPNHASEGAAPIWDELRRLISEHRPSAIGEIGLDYYRDHASKEQQREVFERQLDLAKEADLPVIIHQRMAEDDLRSFLRRWTGRAPWVLHSFEGSRDLAAEALAAGGYFGVGGLMTRANSAGLRDVLADIPLDRLLLETDSPYLVPRGVKSRRNEPTAIPLIAAALAQLKGVSIGEVAKVTTQNAERVLHFAPGSAEKSV